MKNLTSVLVAVIFSVAAGVALAGAEQVPMDRTITRISAYKQDAYIHFTPPFENNQGCNITMTTRLQVNFDTENGKEMFAAALAAAAGNKKVGFGVSGCSTNNGNPLIYRNDVKY